MTMRVNVHCTVYIYVYITYPAWCLRLNNVAGLKSQWIYCLEFSAMTTVIFYFGSDTLSGLFFHKNPEYGNREIVMCVCVTAENCQYKLQFGHFWCAYESFWIRVYAWHKLFTQTVRFLFEFSNVFHIQIKQSTTFLCDRYISFQCRFFSVQGKLIPFPNFNDGTVKANEKRIKE